MSMCLGLSQTNKTAEYITPGNFFYSFGVFGGKSLQFAGSLTCERQWTMAQTRHKDLGEVQFSSEKCKLIVEDLLPTKVHYVLFWTSRLVFPERREL